MERGSYAAASGGLVQLRRLDVVNNNLANVNTPGFKRQLLVGTVQSFDETFAKAIQGRDPYAEGDHKRTPNTVNVRSVTDFSQGPVKNTGNPLDVALRNQNDFFVIETPSGPQYTRAGNFTLNSDGALVTADGFAVSGDGGAITTTGLDISIATNGSVRSDGAEAGRLAVVRFEDPSVLERVGSSRFQLPRGKQPPAAIEADLIPSSLEMSNVSAISSVIELIVAQRGFETYTKSAQTIDQMNQTAITQVGRSRL